MSVDVFMVVWLFVRQGIVHTRVMTDMFTRVDELYIYKIQDG